MHDGFCNMPWAYCWMQKLFSHMLVYTPWRRRRSALGAPCALCARRRCAVTTLCTPRARRGSAVARRGRYLETPLSPWARRDIPTLWKKENYSLYFFSIFVRSHGALRNFKSPCQRRGIAVECDRGFSVWRRHCVSNASSRCPLRSSPIDWGELSGAGFSADVTTERDCETV